MLFRLKNAQKAFQRPLNVSSKKQKLHFFSGLFWQNWCFLALGTESHLYAKSPIPLMSCRDYPEVEKMYQFYRWNRLSWSHHPSTSTEDSNTHNRRNRKMKSTIKHRWASLVPRTMQHLSSTCLKLCTLNDHAQLEVEKGSIIPVWCFISGRAESDEWAAARSDNTTSNRVTIRWRPVPLKHRGLRRPSWACPATEKTQRNNPSG